MIEIKQAVYNNKIDNVTHLEFLLFGLRIYEKNVAILEYRIKSGEKGLEVELEEEEKGRDSYKNMLVDFFNVVVNKLFLPMDSDYVSEVVASASSSSYKWCNVSYPSYPYEK